MSNNDLLIQYAFSSGAGGAEPLPYMPLQGHLPHRGRLILFCGRTLFAPTNLLKAIAKRRRGLGMKSPAGAWGPKPAAPSGRNRQAERRESQGALARLCEFPGSAALTSSYPSTFAIASSARSSCARGQAMFRRIKPSPSLPKIVPSLTLTCWASSASIISFWGMPRARQSSHIK